MEDEDNCIHLKNLSLHQANNEEEALNLFREVFSMVLFFIASDKNEESKIKDIINICTEYCYLIRMNQIKEKIKSVYL